MVVVAGLVAEVAVVAVASKPPSLLVPIAVVDSSNQSIKDQLGEETLKVQKKANHLLVLSAHSDPIQVANQKETPCPLSFCPEKPCPGTKLGC